MAHIRALVLLVCAAVALLLAVVFYGRATKIEVSAPLLTRQMVEESQSVIAQRQRAQQEADASRKRAQEQANVYRCQLNEDCIIVDQDPCGCLHGPSGVTAINADQVLTFQRLMSRRFAKATTCPDVGSTVRECSATAHPVCVENRCKIAY